MISDGLPVKSVMLTGYAARQISSGGTRGKTADRAITLPREREGHADGDTVEVGVREGNLGQGGGGKVG